MFYFPRISQIFTDVAVDFHSHECTNENIVLFISADHTNFLDFFRQITFLNKNLHHQQNLREHKFH